MFNSRLALGLLFYFSTRIIKDRSGHFEPSTQPLPTKPRALRIQLIAAVAAILSASDGLTVEQNLAYNAVFTIQLSADQAKATGTLSIDQPSQIMESMKLRMPADRYRLISADGDSHRVGDIVHWIPPVGQGKLLYEVMINQPRGRAFDGLINEDWAIFRGDNIFPTARVNFVDGARSRSRLLLRLPDGWKQITPYKTDDTGGWVIDNPGFKFGRPTGWILAGRLGIKRETIAGMRVTVAAPVGSRAQRVAMLALLRWNLAWFLDQVPVAPDRLLIVSGPDPLWRGGLSAKNSLFLHADLPLISNDGSSPLMHEIAHVLFPVDAAPEADWIDEGLAEYLSLRVLKETGTISPARYERSISHFRKRGKRADSLQSAQSKGDVTAKAVVLFHDLNDELQQTTEGKLDMMDLTRRMMDSDQALTLGRIRTMVKDMIGATPGSL